MSTSAGAGSSGGRGHASESAPRPTRLELVVVAISTVVAAGVMARSLDAKSLWIDEAISVHVAGLDAADLWRFVSTEEMNMALYHLLLSGWTEIFGFTEPAVRSLSVLFAVLAVPTMYGVGARLFSPRVGAVAALLLALNATHVSYGRETRSYALTLFLVVLATYCLARALAGRQRWLWVAYAVVAVLSVYAHLFAALVIVAQLLALVISRRQLAIPGRTIAWTTAGIGVALVPAAIHVAGGETGRTTDQGTEASDIVDLIFWYGGSYRPLAALYALSAALAVVVAWRRRLLGSWPYVFVLTWLAVPIALALAISITIDPMFVFRYLLVTLPALLLLVAAGISAIGSRVLFIAALAVVCALSLRWLAECHPGCQTPTQDFRAATAHIVARADPGDAIYFDPPYLKTAFVYYASRDARFAQSCQTFFCSGEEDRTSLGDDAPRAWLLVDDGDPNTRRYREIPGSLSRRYRDRAATQFTGSLRIVEHRSP